MTKIFYKNGDYWVTQGPKGKGFEVYNDGVTHAVRVAQIGYDGEKGLKLAIAEAARRARGDV